MIPASQENIQFWISKSTQLFIKKLSRNDCVWADGPEFGHQNGVYIPREIRETDFFPPLRNINLAKPHIFETQFSTFWPETGEFKTSNLKHYSNKGSEMHFTGVPKEYFTELTPASMLLGGTLKKSHGESHHWFMVIDSASDEAEILETIFDLNADFHFGLFAPKNISNTSHDESEQLIQELSESLKAGTLDAFIASVSQLPPSSVLASRAQQEYLAQHGLQTLNPYELENPGDAIMKISRDIEYKLYKRAELRHRAAEVVRIITEKNTDLVTAVVRGFTELDATFLSASQHRKSRAGRSFEQHIGRLLSDGNISFEEQAVTGGRRPDFVLPNLMTLKDTTRSFNDALILSAKTTLRERWKQIAMEKFNCSLFLATVDDRVSADAIHDMQRQEICLVVPESLKKAKETCYKDKENVITFRAFFDEHIPPRSNFRFN
ncbi:type II restriction endonuclease [Undibacterium macrobrachii]|uniref:Type II restriction endonuclease n=1 Tax=Undibacterium macrobrachii TaxID=1119058 RepID=A0ABQ2XCX0_9BURK|nr:type II restriction endonuclease [Undibacterium macrobrachii]GGX10728.1 type II restriction endonuclease [Undibacterium macrobrachii]